MRGDSEITVVLAGEADVATIDQLRDALFDPIAERPSRVVVDLSELIFMDSMSISTLIAAHRAALEHDVEFVVTNPRGQVLKVLTVSGVLEALTAGEPGGSQPGLGVSA